MALVYAKRPPSPPSFRRGRDYARTLLYTICPSIHIPMLTSHFQQLQKLSMLSITSHCKENISNPVLEDWWKPWFQSGLQAKIGGGTTQQHEAQNKLTHTLHFVLAMQLELNDNSTAPFYLRRSHAGQWMINLLCMFDLAHGGLWKPNRHGNIGNWGHWVQFWGQMWPPRLFGGRHSLRGHQNGCLRQPECCL